MGKNIILYIKNVLKIVRLVLEMEILLKINALYAKMDLLIILLIILNAQLIKIYA